MGETTREMVIFIGFLCIFLGAWGAYNYYPSYQQIHSNAGQLAALMNPKLQTQYNEIDRLLYASVIGVIVGIVFLVLGYFVKGPIKTPVEKPIVAEVNAGDITERMEKLKDLYEKKLITEEEYNKRKSELLSKI